MDSSTVKSRILVFLMCALLSAAGCRTSVALGGTLNLYGHGQVCSVHLDNGTVARNKWTENFPGCTLGHIDAIAFEDAPSAVTVQIRSFAYDYGKPYIPPDPSWGYPGQPAEDPAPNISDCNADQPRYPFRLEIKTTGSIAGTGKIFDVDDMLAKPVKGAVVDNVRMMAKSTDWRDSHIPLNYLISCIKIIAQ